MPLSRLTNFPEGEVLGMLRKHKLTLFDFGTGVTVLPMAQNGEYLTSHLLAIIPMKIEGDMIPILPIEWWRGIAPAPEVLQYAAENFWTLCDRISGGSAMRKRFKEEELRALMEKKA